jgi:branched-chain amino acid transport system ATP-binding protein
MMGALYGAKNMSEARAEAIRWVDFVNLNEKKNYSMDGLTHAEYRRLEIGRALATRPELLLLDEPLGGLTPREVLDACDLVRKINTSGITVVMVEHVMKGVMSLSHRIMVINHGEKIAEGNPAQIATDEQVVKAYLGKVYVAG